MIVTEKILLKYSALVKLLTGLPAENFWELMEKMKAHFAKYEQQRYERAGRQRAVGAGRPYDQPLVIRVVWRVAGMCYHIPAPSERHVKVSLYAAQAFQTSVARCGFTTVQPWLWTCL